MSSADVLMGEPIRPSPEARECGLNFFTLMVTLMLHVFGLVSDVPFDRVRVGDIAGIALIDDIRLAMQVPGPGAGGLMAIIVAGAGRRRRVA